MAILTSLFSGISGLNAFGQGLSVVSNNIANLNTVGFKDSTVSFADIISENIGTGNGGQVGRGVFVDSIQTEFSQGSFETSGNMLDLALEGEGFFVVQNPAGARGTEAPPGAAGDTLSSFAEVLIKTALSKILRVYAYKGICLVRLVSRRGRSGMSTLQQRIFLQLRRRQLILSQTLIPA